MNVDLTRFVSESNRIEDIHRPPYTSEIEATMNFIRLDIVTVSALEDLVHIYEPSAKLREQYGMEVFVSDHVPPKGGPYVRHSLERLLIDFKRGENKSVPYLSHQYYEELHPFTDGNGRSGRALWLWYMRGNAPLGFLHEWYYQSMYESQTD